MFASLWVSKLVEVGRVCQFVGFAWAGVGRYVCRLIRRYVGDAGGGACRPIRS